MRSRAYRWTEGTFEWHRALTPDELAEGRVKTVSLGRRSLAISLYRGGFGALDNRCPHQGGPLGEGSIEQGWARRRSRSSPTRCWSDAEDPS